MPNGTITSLRDRGFGFIARQGPGGDDDALFFHRSEVANDAFDRLRAGQHVSFDEESDPRDPTRLQAVNVHPLPAVFE